VKVLQHSTKKPGCKAEVLAYFEQHPDSGVTSPSQIAVVGDRLFTDVMMANLMGSHGFWIKDGIIDRKTFVSVFRRR
jgi:phosphatidylglycerophosphatase GEP4